MPLGALVFITVKTGFASKYLSYGQPSDSTARFNLIEEFDYDVAHTNLLSYLLPQSKSNQLKKEKGTVVAALHRFDTY